MFPQKQKNYNLKQEVNPVESQSFTPSFSFFGIVSRLIFLFIVSLVTGIIFGQYLTPSQGNLGAALSSTFVAPLALVSQLIAFGIASAFYPLWFVYPILGLSGIGMGHAVRGVLTGFFIPINVVVGLQLFVAYLILFSVTTISQIAKKKRRISFAITPLVAVWIIVIGGYAGVLGYAKEAALIAVPIGSSIKNDTNCIEKSFCQFPLSAGQIAEYYQSSYTKNEKLFQSTILFKKIKFTDTLNQDKTCSVISRIPHSTSRYEFYKSVVGTKIFRSVVTNVSEETVQTGKELPGGGWLNEPGEGPKKVKKETTKFYYCYVKGLNVYETYSHEEDYPIDDIVSNLQLKIKTSSYKYRFGER